MQHELSILPLVVYIVLFLQSYKQAPPAAVINVLAAVMVPLAPRGGVSEDRSWKTARALMSKVRLSSRQSPLLD